MVVDCGYCRTEQSTSQKETVVLDQQDGCGSSGLPPPPPKQSGPTQLPLPRGQRGEMQLVGLGQKGPMQPQIKGQLPPGLQFTRQKEPQTLSGLQVGSGLPREMVAVG